MKRLRMAVLLVGSLFAPSTTNASDTCYVVPSTQTVNQPLTVYGSGFHANASVEVSWFSTDYAWQETYFVTADGSGNVTSTESEGDPVAGGGGVVLSALSVPKRLREQCYFTIAS